MSWRTGVYGLVRHPELPALLMLRGGDKWNLPRKVVPEPLWPGDVEGAVAALEKRLGTGVWINRPVSSLIEKDSKRITTLVETDLVDSHWKLPAHGRWVEAGELERLRLRDERFREVLERFLAEVGEGPAERSPWNKRGWVEGVREWLASLPIGRLQRIDQVKQWGISNALRVTTSKGSFYFKVSAPLPLFVNEAVVVPVLSELFPGYVEPPVAVDEDRGWLLLRDLGEPSSNPSIEHRTEFYRKAARLHVASAAQIDGLLAGGCIDRRLEVLPDHVGALFSDETIMTRLAKADRDALMSIDVQRLCEMVAELGLPPTLVHGDLHQENAVLTEGGFRLFDWSDACVSMPLFDLHELDRMEDPGRQRVEAAYLDVWNLAIDGEMAGEIKLLRSLHHAVSYRAIANGLEPAAREELDFAHHFLGHAAAIAREVERYTP